MTSQKRVKNACLLVLSLLGLTTLSCSVVEDPSVLSTLKLVSTTDYQSGLSEPVSVHRFSYLGNGALAEFDQTHHSYNELSQLTAASDRDITESFTYGPDKQLQSITRTFHHSPQQPPFTLHLAYNTQGKLSRMSPPMGSAVLFTYDQHGNLSKVEQYAASPSGELGDKHFEIEAIYDDKKNPFQGLGSLISTKYNSLSMYLPIPYLNLFSYLSAHNVTSLTLTEFPSTSEPVKTVLPYRYQYNQQGLPVQIQVDQFTQRLEYKAF